MPEAANEAISRRVFVRGAALAVPALGLALAAPRALADPQGPNSCPDPNETIDNCVVQLPEQFTSTSFSTTAVPLAGSVQLNWVTRRLWLGYTGGAGGSGAGRRASSAGGCGPADAVDRGPDLRVLPDSRHGLRLCRRHG